MKPLIIPIFIPFWGCRQKCVFCDQGRIAGRSEANINASSIGRAVESHLLSAATRPGRFGGVEVAFYGGTFTALPEAERGELLGAVAPFLRSGRVDSVRVSTRPDAIDPDVLDQLREGGVCTVELGAQSLDDEVLALSGRGYRGDDVRKASALVTARGFNLGLQFMLGLPGDNRARSIATSEQCVEIRPDFVRIYPTVVIEGTQLASMYRRGEYGPLGVDETVGLCLAWVRRLRKAKIDVIRIGLHPSIAAGDSCLLAGPHHPALRHLVESDLAFEVMSRAIGQMGLMRGANAITRVPGAELSNYVGHRRRNLELVKLGFGLDGFKVIEDGFLAQGYLSVEAEGRTESFNSVDLL